MPTARMTTAAASAPQSKRRANLHPRSQISSSPRSPGISATPRTRRNPKPTAETRKRRRRRIPRGVTVACPTRIAKASSGPAYTTAKVPRAVAMIVHQSPRPSTSSSGASAAMPSTRRQAAAATSDHSPSVIRLGATEKSNPRVETLRPETDAHSAKAHSGITEYGSCEPSPTIQHAVATTKAAGTTMRSIFTTSSRTVKIVRRRGRR